MSDDLFDARVRFYLEHREDIERWAALRTDAQSAVLEWLGSLEGSLGQFADTLVSRPHVFRIPGFSAIGLSLPHWPATVEGPTVAIALGWFNNRSGHSDGYVGTIRPYLGIWAADPVHEASLRSAASCSGLGGPGWGRSWQQWPAWRWLPGTPSDWWMDLGAEGERLIAAFGDLWPQALPVVEASLKPNGM